MRHNHQLLDHPLFEERPIKEILEPFGFEVDVQFAWVPDPDEQPAAAEKYGKDPGAYIDSLSFEHPAGYTVVYRGENEDSEIFSVAVRAKTVFAQYLLAADDRFAQRSPYLDVWSERMRQLSVKEFSRKHDDQHAGGEMAAAAGCYALTACMRVPPVEYDDDGMGIYPFWPWPEEWWKPSANPRRNLIKAGALILAEIERLDRAAQQQGGEA